MNEKQIKAKKKEKSEKKTTGKPVKSKREMTDKLVKIDQTLNVSKKCALTKTSLIFDKSITKDEFIDVGRCLILMRKIILWWIGDWGLFGEFNKDFWLSPAIGEVRESYSDRTIENAVWICKKIEPSRRREKLSFGHHQVVAPLEPEEQDKYLEEAEEQGYSVMMLRKRIKYDKESKKESADNDANVIDPSGKPYFYLDYISSCSQTIDKLDRMIDSLIDFKERCRLTKCITFLIPASVKVVGDEEYFVERAESLIKGLEILLSEVLNNKIPQEKTDAKDKKDSDDIEEPKDEPKIEEVKKEDEFNLDDIFDD